MPYCFSGRMWCCVNTFFCIQLTRAFSGLHRAHPSGFRCVRIERLRETRVWISREVLLAFVFRGSQRGPRAVKTAAWGTARGGARARTPPWASLMPSCNAERTYRRPGPTACLQIQMEMEIENQLLQSPLFQIKREKMRKTKTAPAYIKQYINLPVPRVSGWDKPAVWLQCFDTTDLKEHAGDGRFNTALWTTKVQGRAVRGGQAHAWAGAQAGAPQVGAGAWA